MAICIGRVSGMLAAGLLVFTASCAIDQEDDIGQTEQAALLPVTWTNTVGVTAVGNNLSKTGANGWNAGAVSVQTLSGDGAVEFTTGEATRAKAVGLSSGDTSQSYTDIDFAFFLTAGGAVRIYEGGVQKATAGTYVAGDVFRIRAISNFAVVYSKNGVILYVSDIAPSFPLLVDTSLNQTGATVQNVVLGDTFWQNAVGVGITGDDLVKTGANGWNAGASSLKSITSDGAVEFTTLENTRAKAAGLSNGDSNQNYTDIDYCIQLTAGGAVRIYEQGLLRATVGTYLAGDVFRVESVAGVVRYRKNGVYLYTSSVAPTFPLLADTALNQNGATLQNVRLLETFWLATSGVSISGYSMTKTGPPGWNAGAVTIPSIDEGGGYVEFTAVDRTTAKAGGLTDDVDRFSYTEIDFGFYLTANGAARIYESGVLKASVGTYQAGFTFRVEVSGGVVTYRKNGVLVYTSLLTPPLPLVFGSSINHTGGQIANVRVVRNPGPECDPHDQTGCVGGEKCAWLQLSPTGGETACVPNGPVAIGGSCSNGTPGPTTGHDDCTAGAACINSRCNAICSIDPDSCAHGVCDQRADLFTDDPAQNTGVCSSNCNPIAQDCAQGDGCYLSLATAEATCLEVPPGVEELTQNDQCQSDTFACFLNGCAPGYQGLLWNGDDQPRLCAAFCSPVNTYLVDPDGDGDGSLVEGADPDGAAPADCSVERTGVAGLTCRFVQSYFVDANGDPLDDIPADNGFCAPLDDDQGDCSQFSLERLYAIFDAAVANGGDGNQAIQDFCNLNPLNCALGCFDLATQQSIVDEYCSSHPDSAACAQ